MPALPRFSAWITGLVVISALSATATAADAPAGPIYQISDRWVLPGTGSWDYLTMDAPLHRLFITRGDRVEVVNTQTGALLGRIANLPGVHGVALAPELHRGYTSNGRANTITEFDYETLAVLREVPVAGNNPDAILYDSASKRLFTFNGRSKDASVLDAVTLKPLATLPMPDKPEFAVADGKGMVFVNIESAPGRLLKIDAFKLAVVANWELKGCDEPTGMAINIAQDRLYSVCDDKVMAVTDAHSGKAVARVAIGKGTDAVSYDAGLGLVFASNGEGNITVVKALPADRYAVAATLATQAGARTMTLDPTTHRLYTVTASFGPVPVPTAEQPKPRAQPLPDSFTVIVAKPTP
jgi:DNA-binding beta-propeller fold protein YncE